MLIHMALIEYSQFGETEMSLADFHSEVNTLRQKEGNETSLMDLEFQVGASSFKYFFIILLTMSICPLLTGKFVRKPLLRKHTLPLR